MIVIIRAVVVPHPPLLVPELVAGGVVETEPIRTACLDAARALAGVADRWLAVATDPAGPMMIDPDTVGTFRGYGVDVPVWLSESRGRDEAAADPALPLPALIAGWLRGRTHASQVRVRLLARDAPADECRRIGEELARSADPVGLLVLGDGSTRHVERAPGGADPRAPAFDEAVRSALAEADADRLLRLDAALAADLDVAGRAAWQVLAGAALTTAQPWHAEVLYSAAPFGVAYHVAVWDPPDRS